MNKKEKQTILVTGGAGFIGFHVSKRLLKLGYKVVVVDNFNDYYDPQIKKDRVKQLRKNKKFKLYKYNICGFGNLKKIFKENKIDKIVHLAAQAGVRYSIQDPWAFCDTNIKGTINVFELAKEYGIKQVIYASSSSVYGDNKPPFSEDTQVNTPLSLYATSKITTELIAYNYQHIYGIPSTGLRFFTAYGPWGRPDLAFFLFTKNILKGKPIELRNFGKMKRNFSYIDDIVDGIVKSLGKVFDYEIINLASDKTIELKKAVQILETKLGKQAIKKYTRMQKGEVVKTQANLDKAKKLLRFQPRVSIEEGLGKFVEWYLGYYYKN